MTKRSYKIGHSREQVSLLPPCVEDYVGRDNPVRAIDAYVDSLDLNALDFCDVGSDGGAGQPPYDPADLLKLYLYGYLNQVRSSRRLEREAQRTTRPGCGRPIASSWCWPAAWTCWAASWWRSTVRFFTATPARPAS